MPTRWRWRRVLPDGRVLDDTLTAPQVPYGAGGTGMPRPVAAALRLLEWLEHWPSNVIPILTYHRVSPLPPHGRPLYPGLISATPSEFADQMEYLQRHHRVLGIEELLDARRGGFRLPPRSVAVTFDDAYADFAEHAWPVMRDLGLPATLFVPTTYPGEPDRVFWWDRLYRSLVMRNRGLALPFDYEKAFRSLSNELNQLPHEMAKTHLQELLRHDEHRADNGVLTWPQLRKLKNDGVTLAPHSRTHPRLDRISHEELLDEVGGSLADLRVEVGEVPPAFAYPHGAHNGSVVKAIRQAGLLIGLTTRRGTNRLGMADWYRLRRINVGRRSSLELIRLQLLPRIGPLVAALAGRR